MKPKLIENYSARLLAEIRSIQPQDQDDEDTVTLKGKILKGKGKPKK